MKFFLHAFFVFVSLAPLHAQASAVKAEEALIDDKYDDALAFARQSGDSTLIDYVRWQQLRFRDEDRSLSSIVRLLDTYPHWHGADDIQILAEKALLEENASNGTVKAFFSKRKPLSGAGKIALASTLPDKLQQKLTLVQQGWVEGDFTRDIEERLISRYRHALMAAHHWQRTDRLLWEDKVSGANRMLSLISADQRKLAEARIALITKARQADAKVGAVPSHYVRDPGLIYDRLRWRHKKGLHSGAREMLEIGPKTVPYPEKWWKYRAYQAREMVEAKNYRLAEKLLLNHGQTDGWQQAEALWMLGWVQLVHRNKPAEAARQFNAMYHAVGTPVSKARAAYWAGRAYEKLHEQKKANAQDTITWYEHAAAHPTVFYGQLATVKLGRKTNYAIFDQTAATANKAILNTPLMRDAHHFYTIDAKQLGDRLAAQSVLDSAAKQGAGTVINHTAQHKRLHGSVKVAKAALREHVILLENGWPIVALNQPQTEPALALAIARQESEMKPDAVSHAGARGLMQLMPATAKRVARQLDIPYSRGKLFDSAYNTRLGSKYLADMIERYNGQLPLAIAAYNAGPGNVDKWIDRFGYIPANLEEALNWLETIPFKETRNYVQRVLENVQVYRYRLHKSPLKIEEDITSGF